MSLKKQVRKVFFVDDEPGICNAVKQTLLEVDCEVTTFDSAEKCLDYLRIDDCGLLITDVNMPGMDGIKLLQEIKKVRPQLPVLIITGYGDIPMAVRAVKAGAVDFIQKPLDEDTFIPMVSDALERTYGNDSKVERVVTPTERTILTLICKGKSNKEIASLLHRSVRTVENHRHRLMKKLGTESTAELVKIAINMGLDE